MPKTIKITDEHFAKLHKIARAMGSGATPTHAFESALDDAHAKHYGASDESEPDESDLYDDEGDDGEEPAPGEIGADADGSMLPGLKTVTDPTPEKDRAQRSLAARKANFAKAMGAMVTEESNPKAARGAVAAAADSVEAASDELPPERRGGKQNPLSTTPSIRRWAQGTSAANATAPRPQRRG